MQVNGEGASSQLNLLLISTSLQRSVTLVGEADRKLLKAAIKHSSNEDQVRHRIIPAEVIQTWVERLAKLKDETGEILKEEKEEKEGEHNFEWKPS